MEKFGGCISNLVVGRGGALEIEERHRNALVHFELCRPLSFVVIEGYRRITSLRSARMKPLIGSMASARFL